MRKTSLAAQAASYNTCGLVLNESTLASPSPGRVPESLCRSRAACGLPDTFQGRQPVHNAKTIFLSVSSVGRLEKHLRPTGITSSGHTHIPTSPVGSKPAVGSSYLKICPSLNRESHVLSMQAIADELIYYLPIHNSLSRVWFPRQPINNAWAFGGYRYKKAHKLRR